MPNHIEQMYLQTVHTESECDSLIKYARKILADVPFDLRQINFLVYGLRQNGKNREADLWEYRLKGIINAILSTGDGKAPETAWFVISPTDEYNIVNRQGFTATEFIFVEPYFDYISIESNPSKSRASTSTSRNCSRSKPQVLRPVRPVRVASSGFPTQTNI